MEIKVNWLKKDLHMEAINETSGMIRIDGSTSIGGIDGGMSPMQLLLAGIGGCSAIDVISILSKQKQNLESLSVDVVADKQPMPEGYSEFKTIHMHFKVGGHVDVLKLERALALSHEKYCSVSKALEKSSKVTYDYELV
jgi:putative redox protein